MVHIQTVTSVFVGCHQATKVCIGELPATYVYMYQLGGVGGHRIISPLMEGGRNYGPRQTAGQKQSLVHVHVPQVVINFETVHCN